MADLPPELQAAFKAEGMSDSELAEVAIELMSRTGCVNRKQYVGYFGAGEDLVVQFCEGKAVEP